MIHRLSSFGNDNIRGCHIEYFENRITSQKENTISDISSAPNYYAWLTLVTEHVFWKMRQVCYRQTRLTDNLALSYNDLITKFCDICRNQNVFSEEELGSLFKLACKILEIRHALIHRGFPNLFPVMYRDGHVRNMPKFTKGDPKAKFTEASAREAIEWYENPQNFDIIKKGVVTK